MKFDGNTGFFRGFRVVGDHTMLRQGYYVGGLAYVDGLRPILVTPAPYGGSPLTLKVEELHELSIYTTTEATVPDIGVVVENDFTQAVKRIEDDIMRVVATMPSYYRQRLYDHLHVLGHSVIDGHGRFRRELQATLKKKVQ